MDRWADLNLTGPDTCWEWREAIILNKEGFFIYLFHGHTPNVCVCATKRFLYSACKPACNNNNAFNAGKYYFGKGRVHVVFWWILLELEVLHSTVFTCLHRTFTVLSIINNTAIIRLLNDNKPSHCHCLRTFLSTVNSNVNIFLNVFDTEIPG